MRIRLLAVGTRMPDWVDEGFRSYQKRLPRDWPLELHATPLGHHGKNSSPERACREEAQGLRSLVGKGDRLVALDRSGSAWSTAELSKRLAQWRMEGRHLSLVVGGPQGLDAELLAESDNRWSLSPLTLPHPLVRVLIAEQIYRAWTLAQGHPYHK